MKIHDKDQQDLPWKTEPVACQRCHGRKQVYRFAIHRQPNKDRLGEPARPVEVVGGHQVTCPECNGTGTVQAPLL